MPIVSVAKLVCEWRRAKATNFSGSIAAKSQAASPSRQGPYPLLSFRTSPIPPPFAPDCSSAPGPPRWPPSPRPLRNCHHCVAPRRALSSPSPSPPHPPSSPCSHSSPHPPSPPNPSFPPHSTSPPHPAQAAAAGAGAAAPGGGEGAAGGSPAGAGLAERVVAFQRAFWKFLRPHTIRGTVLGTSAVVARALLESPQAIDWGLMPRALRGLLALLCGNGYIVGINQIYDTDIDRVNKPFLPVAAGELSPTLAALLCLLLSAGGLAIVALNFGRLITGLYALGLLLGTVYSVPPLRLKQYPLPAFLIIATVRGFLLNFGVYYATRAALGLPFAWSPSIVFITCFVTLFATVIAITKDLPDIEGDRQFKIETFATRLGVRNIAFLGSGLLIANYCGAVAAALLLPHAFRQAVMIPAHLLLAAALVYQTWKLDAAAYTKDAIARFYQFIWNLFYLEYCLLPII
ncbi:unnamed protein product [Closterium sp. Naga37s-1]|nr:unnamed protein product [Closterium sp. Naga37s-1]